MGNNIRSSSRESPCPLDSYAAAGGRDGRIHLSVDRFCLLAGVEALAEMMERHDRVRGPTSSPWEPAGAGHIAIGYHGGKVKVARRVRPRRHRKVGEPDLNSIRCDAACDAPRLCARRSWLSVDLLDPDPVCRAVLSIVDGNGDKHVLAVVEGARRTRSSSRDRQSPRQGARSDTAAAVHRRSQQSGDLRRHPARQEHHGCELQEGAGGTRTTQTRRESSGRMRNRASRAACRILTVRPAARTPALARLLEKRQSAATSDGAQMDRPACWRPRKPSVASRQLSKLSGTLEKGAGAIETIMKAAYHHRRLPHEFQQR